MLSDDALLHKWIVLGQQQDARQFWEFVIVFNKYHCSARWEFNSWCVGLETKRPSVLHTARLDGLRVNSSFGCLCVEWDSVGTARRSWRQSRSLGATCRVLGNGLCAGPPCTRGWVWRLLPRCWLGRAIYVGVAESVVLPALLAWDQYLGSINFSNRKWLLC